MKAATISLAALGMLIGIAPALAQSPSPNAHPCPPGATTTGQANPTADAKPSQQAVEHSAILPNATGHNESAAPTVQQNGEAVVAQTECPKPANQIGSEKPNGAK